MVMIGVIILRLVIRMFNFEMRAVNRRVRNGFFFLVVILKIFRKGIILLFVMVCNNFGVFKEDK